MSEVFKQHKESSDDSSVTSKILIAMIAAIICGCLYHQFNLAKAIPLFDQYFVKGALELVGQYFVRALKMVVVPLVFFSLISGLTSGRDPNQPSDSTSSLGRRALLTFLLYMGTTMIAVTLALLLASVVDPGAGVEIQSQASFTPPAYQSPVEALAEFIPTNIFQAFASGNMLAVIFVSLVFGIAMNHSGEVGQRLGGLCQDINEIVIKVIFMIISYAPYGVFALVFKVFADQGVGFMANIAAYFMTVIAGLVLQFFLVYCLIVTLLGGQSPIVFIKKMWQVMVFAFSTASSAATISVNLKTAIERFGIKKEVASFTIPLGATVNMDGTAIMQGVAVIFIAGAYGIDLTMFQLVEVVILATLASVGTAAVPSAGLVTLSVVLLQVNLPAEAIGLIIGVDRLLDMIRTAVNVAGDAAVTIAVAKSEKALDADVFNT